MNDNDIYKIAYNTIKQAIEWGTNKDLSVQFAQYTEGVIEFAENIIKYIGRKNNEIDYSYF